MTIQRNTIQRSAILATVNCLKSHPTADEVYDEISKTYPTISRATVYRNLNQLWEGDCINKIEVPNGADCFDHIVTKHYHIKCSTCGKVFDVEMEYIEDLEKSIRNSNGFDFSGHDIIFKGVCPKCKIID